MALLKDDRNRLTSGGDINFEIAMKISQMVELGPTAVSTVMVSSIFSPVKDLISGYTIQSSNEQFEHWCKIQGWNCVFDVNYTSYIIRKVKMSKTPGKLVQYIDNDGNTKKAIAYNHEQTPEIVKYKKVYLHYMNDDLTPKMDKGKKVVGLRSPAELKVIGFVD